MKYITLSSCYNVVSGYNTLLNALLTQLPKNNFVIRPRSYEGVSSEFKCYFENIIYKKECCDLLLMRACNHIDNTHPIFHLQPHKCRLYFTMWESSRASDAFIDQANKMKALIVPNNWNKINFENQGCEVPIHVCPLFVNTRDFYYLPPLNDDIFVFGSGNSSVHKRLYQTIKCFLKAFPNEKDVKLKIKSYSNNFKFNDSRIEIIHHHQTIKELCDWYHSINVFVSGVAAEGWGLMQHESMVCGRPVIAANYAGLKEFMNENNGFCLNYDEVPSEGWFETPGGKYSKYDEDHMIETMRFCYKNRDLVHKKGILASDDAKKFNLNNFIENITKIIDIYT